VSESVYLVSGKRVTWEDFSIQFSEMDDDWQCLCTFPHNDGAEISLSRLRSLALLGAAVVLAHNGELEEETNFLPLCIPKWIRDEITSKIK
jgi:hypothetical protein